VARRGIKIREVEPDSPASRAGLAAGDEILTLNGHPIPDELALRFYLADEEHVELEVVKADGVEVTVGSDLTDSPAFGVEVEDFRTRTCNNDCIFCFVNQLPPGVRPSLKIKDDDYRLSFLHGNYITLTNLSDRELDRIIDQALSPLYVSVHATELELRTRIMGRKKADDLAGKMRKLLDGGIRINAQVVLMPEINDGEHLSRTVFDLYSCYPGVNSVAIVPLGLSDHCVAQRRFNPVTPDFCRKVIHQVAPWQRRFRQETARGFAYLADEFYIQGGLPIPDAAAYDEFDQIEDGIGMVRRFLDEFAAHLGRRHKHRPHLCGTLATGKLFYPFLRDCIARLNRKLGSNLLVAEVENRFLGRRITVAGLLAGRDFAEALADRQFGDFVIVPNEAVSQVEGIFVDDWSPDDLARSLGKPVLPSGRTMHDFFRLLFEQL
jgi:putative radical SAM enzyme (TIGR03279 family)